MHVIEYTTDVVDHFLHGTFDAFVQGARHVVGRQSSPIAIPGEILHQDL